MDKADTTIIEIQCVASEVLVEHSGPGQSWYCVELRAPSLCLGLERTL